MQQLDIGQQSQSWFKQLPKDWQDWLKENMARGCEPQQLAEVLKQHGFYNAVATQPSMHQSGSISEEHQQWLLQQSIQGQSRQQMIEHLAEYYSVEVIGQYLDDIQNNALYRPLLQTYHQLQKREWLMQCLDILSRLDTQQIPRIQTPSFQDFITNYYSQHRPVILQNGIEHWAALKKWNPQYFVDRVGDEQIEIQMDRSADIEFERHSPRLKQKMTMQEFVQKIQAVAQSNDFYMTANNTAQNQNITQKLYADIGDFGQGYCDLSLQNQLCFLWFGPKGTFTPLHHDLTNNMLVQVYGRKKVTLVPALQTPYLYNHQWVFSQLYQVQEIDFEQYPLAKHLSPIECILEAGEALFIPIGWWHTVESLDVSISVSFTHFNAPNQFYTQFPKDPD